MCPLSDQKDFEICHHIREKRCATQFLWTRGHTVAAQGMFDDLVGHLYSRVVF